MTVTAARGQGIGQGPRRRVPADGRSGTGGRGRQCAARGSISESDRRTAIAAAARARGPVFSLRQPGGQGTGS